MVEHKYNFDEIIKRTGTYSYKWDLMKDPDILPLWVADMDFKAAPAIYEAVNRLAKQGCYGYGVATKEYYEAIVNFHKRHYAQHVEKDWILSSTAVVPALTAILQALSLPGDEVIVQTPAYNCFFGCIKNSSCVLAENKLVYKYGRFSLDFDNLEELACHEKARFMLLCNPHNPSGRLWTKEELLSVIEIAKRHNLIVISDEIHCDIRPNGSVFHALTTLDESFNNNVITMRSGSKTFNIAGLKNAYIFTQNKEFLNRIDRQFNINEINDLSPFGIAATVAAYNNCDDWIVELNDYIQDNYKLLVNFFNENFKEVKVSCLESTYLAWVDCSCFNMTGTEIKNILLRKGRLYVNDGEMYMSPYSGFLRINLGCPKSYLEEALKRFKLALG